MRRRRIPAGPDPARRDRGNVYGARSNCGNDDYADIGCDRRDDAGRNRRNRPDSAHKSTTSSTSECGAKSERRRNGQKTTTVREGVVGAPAVVAAPSVVAVPAYDAPLQGPRLYDVLTLAPAVPVDPAVTPAATIQGPGYRYVYQPDRGILVVDPYTNVAVQAIPR